VIYFSLIAVINFLAMFNTQTRGAAVGIFIGIAAMLLFYLFSGRVAKKIKYYTLAFLIIFVLLVSSIFVFKDSQFIKDSQPLRRISHISINDTTAQTRLLTWEASLKGFKEKPILGWGEEKFYVVFNKYFPTAIFKDMDSRVWFDRPHNIFLQHLVQAGILGLAAYIFMFYLVFYYLFRHYKKTGDAISVSILGGLSIAYLVQNFFVFDSLNSYILMILLLAMVVFITKRPEKFEGQPKEASKSTFLPAVLFLIVIIVGYISNVPQSKANKAFVEQLKWIQADIVQNVFDVGKHDKMIEIINSQYLGKFELRQVYNDYAISILQNKNTTLYQKSEALRRAESELLKSIEQQPDHVRHYAFLTNLYLTAAESLDPQYADKNIAIVEKALVLSPTRTHFYYSLGRSYMIKNEHQQAIESLIKARELSPNIFESYVNLFAAYLFAKDTANAEQVLEDLKNNENLRSKDNGYLYASRYSRLAEIYFVFDMVPPAIELLKEATSIYPKESRLLAQIIVYYVDQGDTENANLYLDQIQSIDPSLYQEVKTGLGL
ncbi:O-antigen ligase family protein, partial [bacterium]|nr:O-antigen ligase family protein [bacterium]